MNGKIQIIILILTACVYTLSNASPLEDIYKQQYSKYKSQKSNTKDLINFYDGIISESEKIYGDISEIESKRNYSLIDEATYVTSIKPLYQRLMYIFQQFISRYNEENGLQREDLSMEEMTDEIVHLRKKLEKIDKDLFDLKVRTVEKLGDLPSWWIDK